MAGKLRYSGILLCSDLDGTLAPTPENLDALTTFTNNGGRFTMATGRRPAHFRETVQGLPINAPVVALNGNAIYDLEADRPIWLNPIPYELVREVLRFTEKNSPDCSEMRANSLTHGTLFSPIKGETADRMLEELAQREELQGIMTLVMVCRPFIREDFRERYAKAFPMLTNVQTWGQGLELHHPDGGKGNAVARLREYLGGRDVIHTVVCVGDQENDLSMIRYADIGYAVANASDVLKAEADRITVSVSENAIARIIEEL